MSTLSVETSSSGSSTATSSPSALSQRVMVPSVTDSPSAGIVTFSPPETSPPEEAASCLGSSDFCSSSEDLDSFSEEVSSAASSVFSSPLSSASAESSEESEPPEASPSPTTARSAPTGTVSSSSTRISCSVPATGDGISVSTLSVETSSSGSSTATVSPTFFSQRVTVPSVTDSPRAGMVTRSDMGGGLLNPNCTFGVADEVVDSGGGSRNGLPIRPHLVTVERGCGNPGQYPSVGSWASSERPGFAWGGPRQDAATSSSVRTAKPVPPLGVKP